MRVFVSKYRQTLSHVNVAIVSLCTVNHHSNETGMLAALPAQLRKQDLLQHAHDAAQGWMHALAGQFMFLAAEKTNSAVNAFHMQAHI